MSMLELIKASLWEDSSVSSAGEEEYNGLIMHSIAMLPASILSKLTLSPELCEKWKRNILKQITYNARYKHVESSIPLTVPYVILKGTAAAKYYLHPEYRTMGDIDIITSRDNFDQAYKELQDNGFIVTKELEREITFVKNGIPIELHRFFASLNDPQKAKYMDDLIIDNINPYHILPDDINGLVILEHINQHLEKGLGLRQIIDWMMFVDKCLPDEKWPSFEKYAKTIGLNNLAIVTTRMCEIYLGLPSREWSSGSDEKLCKQLLDYVMACGNFGNTRSENIGIGDNVFYYSSSIKSFFSLLQKRGLTNWKVAQAHKCLKPFAWLYQAFRYMHRGMNREDAPTEIIKEHKSAKQRIKMFEELGVRQSTKGLTVYKDGKYKKHRVTL